MAAAVKSVLKVTTSEAVVKVQGDTGSATIDLQTDLLSVTESVVPEADQVANIVTVGWAGLAGGSATVTRNGIPIISVQGGAPGCLDFAGQLLTPENTENTSDLVVTMAGAQMEIWIRMRKLSGYRSSVETSVFGSYDDPELVGE